MPLGESGTEPRTAVLPMRLCDWRLAPEGKTFAYGGDEVELSVWDLEAAFAPKQPAVAQTSSSSQPEASRKRKRGNDLLPGELWRAKNARHI
jgi:ribosome biogenesis protein NSA1